jgi:hypothetical protein
MSYSFIQTPATMSLAQSPMIFSVSSSQYTNENNFQYIGELYIWTGSQSASSSAEIWTLAKYPSSIGKTGIFDVSRIVNSTQTQLVQQNISPITYCKLDSYYRYYNGTAYVTGSLISSPLFKSIDGYQIFPETIGQQVYNLTPQWPLMTDGPATQSVFIDNIGQMGVYVGQVGTSKPTSLIYSGSNGSNAAYSLTPSDGNSNNEVVGFPIAPAQSGFPLSTVGLDSFTIRAKSESISVGAGLKFNVDCIQKYPNIRIKWKNRFGEFDYFNFYMVNRKSMGSTKRTYQPQLGSWQGSTLSYNEYDSQTLNYIVDSKQNIVVNTNWIDESYNDIFKQLLVSNEIYWCQENTTTVKPITIVTSNIQFKTGVVDKLIQYSFEFQYGQGYKLII